MLIDRGKWKNKYFVYKSEEFLEECSVPFLEGKTENDSGENSENGAAAIKRP